MRSALLPSSDMVLQLYEPELWVFSCSFSAHLVWLDQCLLSHWRSCRAVRGRVRCFCHRGLWSKTDNSEEEEQRAYLNFFFFFEWRSIYTVRILLWFGPGWPGSIWVCDTAWFIFLKYNTLEFKQLCCQAASEETCTGVRHLFGFFNPTESKKEREKEKEKERGGRRRRNIHPYIKPVEPSYLRGQICSTIVFLFFFFFFLFSVCVGCVLSSCVRLSKCSLGSPRPAPTNLKEVVLFCKSINSRKKMKYELILSISPWLGMLHGGVCHRQQVWIKTNPVLYVSQCTQMLRYLFQGSLDQVEGGDVTREPKEKLKEEKYNISLRGTPHYQWLDSMAYHTVMQPFSYYCS